MRMMRRMIGGLGTALALTAVPVAAQESGIALGTRAPDARVETLEGKAVSLRSLVGKTPVVLQFWATWCGNCRQLEPAMRAARAKYGKKVRFVAVAVSVNQSVERVRRYQARHKLPLEMFYDRTGSATEAYDVPATSFIVVLDAKGTVVYTGVGGDQNVDAAIRKAL